MFSPFSWWACGRGAKLQGDPTRHSEEIAEEQTIPPTQLGHNSAQETESYNASALRIPHIQRQTQSPEKSQVCIYY